MPSVVWNGMVWYGVEKCYRERRCRVMPIIVGQPRDSHTRHTSQLQLGNPAANSGREKPKRGRRTQIMYGKLGKVPTLAEMCCKYASATAAAIRCIRGMQMPKKFAGKLLNQRGSKGGFYNINL